MCNDDTPHAYAPKPEDAQCLICWAAKDREEVERRLQRMREAEGAQEDMFDPGEASLEND